MQINKSDISIRPCTIVEHNEGIEAMGAHFDDQDAPKVGIFWFDRASSSLFGVVAIDKNSYSKPNVGGGLITCRELHKHVWQKGYNRQKFKLNGVGPFVGDYKDTPRGRVFYNPHTNTFEIRVGSWFKDHPESYQEIIDEFDLQNVKTEIIIDWHWDIGSGWENL